MDRNVFRPGWRRYTPRYARQVGFRGRLLILLGVAWLFLGIGVLDHSLIRVAGPTEPLLHELLPEWFRGSLWIVAGVVAIVTAWRPPGFNDASAWVLLYIPPAIRLVGYTVGWLDSFLPFGAEGWAGGWVSAVIYAVMVGVVFTCSDWPEPPRTLEALNNPHTGR